jgi:tetratricopeptide (TPR) repeat protein
MFDSSSIRASAMHVENEYAQVLEETGIVGLGLLIVLAVIICGSYIRSSNRTNSPIHMATYGLGFGLFAVLLHSFSDFGQHLPANGFLSAIFCGLILSLARQREQASAGLRVTASVVREKSFRVILLIGVSAIWVWAVIGAGKARAGEAEWRKVVAVETNLPKRIWRATRNECDDLILAATQAVNRDPRNIKYRYWLNVYRWRAIDQQMNLDNEEVIISGELKQEVRDIVDQLYKVCLLCPTYGPAHTVAGQIEKFVLKDNSGSAKIKNGHRLAPCDPMTCFAAGCLDVSEGRYEDSLGKFDRAVKLDGKLFNDVVSVYVTGLSRPDLAISAAGENVHHLKHVADVLEEMQYNDLAQQTRQKTRRLLEMKCSQPDAPAWALAFLGDICRGQEDDKAAMEYYRRALALDYSQVEWRLNLAQVLARMEKVPEAMGEARICLRISPQLKSAERLVKNLSVHPAVLGAEIKSP